MAKNDFLARQKSRDMAFINAGLCTGRQQMCDAISIALRDPAIMGKDTFGAKRLNAVLHRVSEILDEFEPAWQKCDDADYYQEKLDDALREAYGAEIDFFKFADRYDMLKQYDYKTGKWK